MGLSKLPVEVRECVHGIERHIEAGKGRLVVSRYKRVVPAQDAAILRAVRKYQELGLVSLITRKRNGMIEHIIEPAAEL